MRGSNRPILLKKSPIVSTADKFAREIEIFTSSKGFRAQFSRSSTSKRRFQRSICPQSENSTFSTESARSGQSSLLVGIAGEAELERVAVYR